MCEAQFSGKHFTEIMEIDLFGKTMNDGISCLSYTYICRK